ncbi:unnamed protein product [Prorocentrum cordatum]|uniref:Uncharacterized protein n=1 Tax=Prorocentrum cordatum TaxID=2364126 RepID=A0ABN9ULP0_9DINO|nr:unnamed protein product [Polarella glacialis]
MSEENLADLGRSWLSRHWSVFDTVLAPGDDELAVRLRPAHAGGDGSVEHSAERRIEAVRSELEDLQRQKQRAVAEEEYGQAAEVKRRVEAASAELASLLRLTEDPTCPDAGDSGWADGPALENGQGRPGRKPKPKAEVFAQDVQDEELFPSLGAPPGRLAPKKAAAGGAGVPAGAGTAAPAAGAAARGAAGAPGSSPDGGSAAGGAAEVMDLEAALVDFLKRHDDGIAHINEVNNNKFIRQVMAAQRPKPMQALNKAWLKEHESAFALLRTSENEMYVGLKKVVEKAAGKNGARGGTADQPRLPAYQNVIQKAAPGEAKPFTYQYSAAARSSSEVEAGNGQLGEWHAKFLAVLRDRPHARAPPRSCWRPCRRSPTPWACGSRGSSRSC